MQVTNGALI